MTTWLFLTVICNHFGSGKDYIILQCGPFCKCSCSSFSSAGMNKLYGCLIWRTCCFMLPHHVFSTGESCCSVKLVSSLYATWQEFTWQKYFICPSNTTCDLWLPISNAVKKWRGIGCVCWVWLLLFAFKKKSHCLTCRMSYITWLVSVMPLHSVTFLMHRITESNCTMHSYAQTNHARVFICSIWRVSA